MKKLQIAVGIIRNPQGEIFITQRAADAHMANKLEFPGGKIESDETPEQALIRELQEEVGITVTASSLFDKLEYQFPDRHITLWFFLVESWQGEPWGKEGQPGRRVSLPSNQGCCSLQSSLSERSPALGMRFSSAAHSPRSISWQRLLQNGRNGLCSPHTTVLPQVGQLTIVSSDMLSP